MGADEGGGMGGRRQVKGWGISSKFIHLSSRFILFEFDSWIIFLFLFLIFFWGVLVWFLLFWNCFFIFSFFHFFHFFHFFIFSLFHFFIFSFFHFEISPILPLLFLYLKWFFIRLNESVLIVLGADRSGEEAQRLIDGGQRFVARRGNGGGHRPQSPSAPELWRHLGALWLLIVAALLRQIALLLSFPVRVHWHRHHLFRPGLLFH